jgi:sigma-B regulation protein RsbU (phosphoserine phosphatase)
MMFFSYTDGLTETFSEEGEPFGLEKVTEVVVEYLDDSLEQINEELLKELNRFRGRNSYNDDITLLSCKVLADK